MATQSKARFLDEVQTLLKRRYKPKLDRAATRPTVLEATLYAICREGATREQAHHVLARFQAEFFDWNEVRVSSLDEIQGVFAGLSDSEGRAYRLRRFLRQLFEKTYGFTLEAVIKKPLKDAMKVLGDYEVFASDYIAATVIQQALGGHAIPIDATARRALERLGVAAPALELAAVRGVIERAVPKQRGGEFIDLIDLLAHDTCVEGAPECPRCELRKVCPTAQARKGDAPAPKSPRVKPGTDGRTEPKPTTKVSAAKHAAPVAKSPKAPKGKSPGSS
jgi:endonuclease-3